MIWRHATGSFTILLAIFVTACDQVPVRFDVEHCLIVAEPGASLERHRFKIHPLTFPLIGTEKMRTSTVKENQTGHVFASLDNGITALMHLAFELRYELLYQLGRAVPFIEIIIEEESKSLYNISENLIDKLLLELGLQFSVKVITCKALIN